MRNTIFNYIDESVNQMYTNCYCRNLWYYIRTNIIRAPLEMALTLYLLEIILIFTTMFTGAGKSYTAATVVYMIFISLGISATTCFAFSFFTLIVVGGWALSAQKKIRTIKEEKGTLSEDDFIQTSRAFSRCMIGLHITGVACYTIITFVVARKFTKNAEIKTLFTDEKQLIGLLSAIGILFGLMWNLYGYCSDMRIDLSKIFVEYDFIKINLYPDIRKKKYKFYICSIVCQFIIVVVIIGVSFLAMLNFNYHILLNDSTSSILSYSGFVTFYIAIITLYLKEMYSLFFSRKYKSSVIFPLIKDFNV